MDQQHLRAVLLKLQDRLSDDDRKRLHFFLANDVPRRVRDDVSLNGTLALIESLFDQDKINERELTYLINALKQIGCVNAVQLLQEYMARLSSNDQTDSVHKLSSIMPTTSNRSNQEVELDKHTMQTLLINQRNNCHENNQIISDNRTNINPITVFVGEQRQISSPKRRFHTSPMFYVCVLLTILFLLIALTILTTFYIQGRHRWKSDLKSKNDIRAQEEVKHNKTLQRIEQLTRQVKDLQAEKNLLLIKAGRKFGGMGGIAFDDSSTPNFTCSHYLSGFVSLYVNPPLQWIQFIYSSSYSDQNLNASTRGEWHQPEQARRFDLHTNEQINKIQVSTFNITYLVGGVEFPTTVIRAVRFFTSRGRMLGSFHSVDDETFTEEFDGYTLGYATGRCGLNVDQLQFYWYRTPSE